MNINKIQKEVESAVARASFDLRPDVYKLIKQAYMRESKKRSKKALKWILDNARIASAERLAICQDTGFPVVFIEASKNVKISASLVEAIKKGVEAGFRKNYLRASVVDPIERNNPGFKGMIYHLDFSGTTKGLRITIFPKGFGSENKTALKMFNPTASLGDIENFVVEAVNRAGPEACPPFVVGIGIGGTADYSLFLAKKALLDKINKLNPDKKLKAMEKNILRKVNDLGIGPMGFGGKTTALAVKIKKSPTHIAGLPVGVNVGCHALRSAVVNIKV